MQPSNLNKYYSLANSIYLFAHAKEEELPHNEVELAQFLTRPVDPKIREDYLHRLRSLALNQLVDPLRESLREGISNACDAQKRAGREERSVEATLDGHTFTLSDQGTGVGYKGLPLLFVDGKTSNPDAIFSVTKGLTDVAGRFGQGFKSLFYYLLYPWKESPQATVTKTADGGLEISIPLFHEEKIYQVLFRKKTGQPVEISPATLDPLFDGKRKMVFLTRQGNDSFQLRFKELRGELCWRLKPKLRATVGTTLTIESPLIERHAQEILTGLSDLFAYLHPSPLLLNKKLVNSYVGMIRYDFHGCVVFVSNERCSEGGRLIIAEKGRPLVTLKQAKGPLVPKTLVLSFAALPLSHERCTLNWNSELVKSAFLNLLKGITVYPKWELSQKMEILNGLAIALRQQYTGLSHQIVTFILQTLVSKSHVGPIIPDSPETRKMGIPNALYIHPDCLKSRLLEQFYYNTLRLIENPAKPIGYFGTPEKGWLFIDAKTLPEGSPEHSFYHTHLDKAWLKNFRQGEGNVSPTIHFPDVKWPPAPSTTLTSQPIQGNFFTAENYTKGTDPKFIEQHLNQFAMNWGYQDRYLKLFKTMASRFTRASFLYLCDFLFIRRKAIVQRWIEKEFEILETWTNYAAEACQFTPYRSIREGKFLTSSDHEREALFVTAAFEQMVAMPTQPMQMSFVYFLVKSKFSERVLSPDSFIRIFLEIFSGTGGCDPNYAHYYFREEHDKLERISASMIKAFFQRIPPPLQEKAFLLFHPLSIDPTHYLDWTDQELSEFIDDTVVWVEKEKSFRVLSAPGYRGLEIRQIQQLHLLYQTIPTHYSRLRQCLIPYIFHDVTQLHATAFQFSLQSFDWDVLIRLLGECVLAAKDEQAGNQAIALFQNTLKLAVAFIENFLVLVSIDPEIKTNQSYTHLKDFEKRKKIFEQTAPMFVNALPAEILTHWSDYMDAYTSLYPIHQIIYDIRPYSKDDQRIIWLRVLNCMERLHLIPDGIRTWVYAFFFSGAKPQAASTNFVLPPITGEKGKLAEDSFVAGYFGSVETARQNIQSARLQNSASPYLYINELLKNGEEAEATEIIVETLFSPNNELNVRFSDNGLGMEIPELESLRTPGKTTKKRTVVGANYGQGVYSVFDPEKKHTSMTVITRTPSNLNGHLHHFTLTPEEIFLQMQAFPKQNPGSTFIITKKVVNPVLDLLSFEAKLIEATRYVKGVKITYNGRVIQGASHNPALTLSTHFSDKNGQPQEILAEIVQGEGALYAVGKKMGIVPNEYLQLIHPFIRDLLQHKGLGISLFFQKGGDQPMGRSQQITDRLALAAVQGLVLRLSFLAVLQEWKNNQLLETLSKDMWDLRKLNVHPLTPQAEALSNYYTDPKNNPLQASIGTKIEQSEFDTLFRDVETYLRASSFLEPQPQSSEELLAQVKRKWDQIEIDQIVEENIRSALLHCPLPGTSLSFQALRRKVIEAVHAARLIVDGQYYHQPTKNIQEVFEGLKNELPPEFEPLLNTFKLHLQGALMSCATQKINQETTPCAPCPELEQFLIRLAKIVFNKDINVIFYAGADNRAAYVRPPSNNIWINLSSDVLPFHRLVRDFNILSRQEWHKLHIPTIVLWIEHLAHELTHLQDGVSCLNNTHDPAFGQRVAANLEPFFQREGPILAIQTLEEILSQ